MHTYFFEGKLTERIELSAEESNHAIKVMRSKEGDRLIVVNGAGERGEGKILLAHHKKCKVELQTISKEERSSSSLSVAIAPTKSNDRIEFFVEKATEIGVDKIIPLWCKNNERNKVNRERWQKVAIAAMKQSKRLWLPEIKELTKLEELLSSQLPEGKLIAYCEDLPEAPISNFKGKSADQILLIGPEGDFTASEVQAAEKKGFVRVNLGTNRLRTETAGIVGVTLLKI